MVFENAFPKKVHTTILNVEHLIVVRPIIIVLDVHFFELHDWLENVLAHMVPKLLFNLYSIFWIVINYLNEPFFSDSHAVHSGVSNMDKRMSFLIQDLESTNNGRCSKLPSQKQLIVYFVAYVILAPFHEKTFERLFHFVANYFSTVVFSDF